MWSIVRCVWGSQAFRVILVGITLISAIAQFSIAMKWSIHWKKVQYGDLGEWFQGVFGFVAVIVAGLAIRAEQSRSEKQRIASDKIREEDLARQAEQDLGRERARAQAVFVWPESIKDPVTGYDHSWQLAIANESGAPVYEWSVRLTEGNEVLASSDGHGPLLPGSRHVRLPTERTGQASPASSDLTLEFLGTTQERYKRVEGVVEVLE